MNISQSIKPAILAIALGAGILLLGACSAEESAANKNKALTLELELPDSLTGGHAVTGSQSIRAVSTGEPCSFIGVEDEDPFKNGYNMTRFMTSVVAAWTCITDTVIDFVDFMPHDGLIHASEDNIKGQADYSLDEPTHWRISDDSEQQTTVRLYYDYAPDAPPSLGSIAEFFISWTDDDAGTLQGRLIIDAMAIDNTDRKADDPSRMRIDFDYTQAEKRVDMVLQFDTNPWANGMRIQVVKDLTANPSTRVFTARGFMDMNRQFLPNVTSTDLPELKMFTVSDRLGKGAAVAKLINLALPLPLNDSNNLGEYVFDNQDMYFFQANRDWDWIEKNIVRSEFRDQRTTPPSGDSWDPFNPSLDLIIEQFQLDSDYFSNGKCAQRGDECNALLNAIFADGFADQEKNQGTDPQDWRSAALAEAIYLDSVYPVGYTSWDGVFETSFNP